MQNPSANHRKKHTKQINTTIKRALNKTIQTHDKPANKPLKQLFETMENI